MAATNTALGTGNAFGIIGIHFEQFLELSVPANANQWGREIEQCSQVSDPSSVPCYDLQSPYIFLAPITWYGTARLLVLVVSVQIILMMLALLWDLTAALYARYVPKKKTEDKYTVLEMYMDVIDFVLSVASCVTFVVRSYNNPTYPQYVMPAVYVVDWVIAGTVTIFYAMRWMDAKSKIYYTLSYQALLAVTSMTSCSAVQVMREGWVPFTFLRALTMNASLRRCFHRLDLPELYENLALALADFAALVFTFAGLVFILENLGNPPGWNVEESMKLSFWKCLWFVTVTSSTVGYGDVFPVSFLGRLAGILIIMFGVYFFSSNISRILSLLQSQADGYGRFSSSPGHNHIIVTGKVDPETLANFSKEFCHHEHDAHQKGAMHLCVLTPEKLDIDRYVVNGDLPMSRLQLLRGSLPAALVRVGMPKVHAIFFLGDIMHKNPTHHDAELMMRASMSRKRNRHRDPQIYMTLLDPESLNYAKGNVALCSTSLKIGFLAQSTFCPGIIPLIGNLLTSVDPKEIKKVTENMSGTVLTADYLHGLQHEIYKVKIPAAYQGQRFGQMVMHNFISSGILIFALGSEVGGPARKGGGGGGAQRTPHDRHNLDHTSHDTPVEGLSLHPGFSHEIAPHEDTAFVIAKEDPQHALDDSVKTFYNSLMDGKMSTLAGIADADCEAKGTEAKATPQKPSPRNTPTPIPSLPNTSSALPSATNTQHGNLVAGSHFGGREEEEASGHPRPSSSHATHTHTHTLTHTHAHAAGASSASYTREGYLGELDRVYQLRAPPPHAHQSHGARMAYGGGGVEYGGGGVRQASPSAVLPRWEPDATSTSNPKHAPVSSDALALHSLASIKRFGSCNVSEASPRSTVSQVSSRRARSRTGRVHPLPPVALKPTGDTQAHTHVYINKGGGGDAGQVAGNKKPAYATADVALKPHAHAAHETARAGASGASEQRPHGTETQSPANAKGGKSPAASAKGAKSISELVAKTRPRIGRQITGINDLKPDFLEGGAPSTGLKWKEAGFGKPRTGTEINNDLLAAALQKKVEFKKEEWETFQVGGNLRSDTYIKAGNRYFQPAGGGHKMVALENHVIVCGMPAEGRLRDFLVPFKFGMSSTNAKNAGGSPYAASYGVVAVLFLWDGPLSQEELDELRNQPEAYVLRVAPLNPSSLLMSNPAAAHRICLLTDRRLASEHSEPVLIDSGVIFAQRFLSQRFPECASKCVCELLDDDSMRFLHHASAAEGLTETTAMPTMPRASTDRKPHPNTAEDGKQAWLQAVFSEGCAFSSSLCTTTLAQSFYNKDLLALLQAFLSTPITNFKGEKGTSSVGDVHLLQADVPPYLQNKPYQELFQALMSPQSKSDAEGEEGGGPCNVLPLGLYRRHDGVNQENYWYVFTNPAPETVVRSEDKVFYLARRELSHDELIHLGS